MAKKEVNKTNKNTKNDKNKKTFFKSFKTELKKVVWPTPKQLVNNTVTVLTLVIICAAIVGVLNVLFETLNEQGINRIRNLVVTEQNTTTNTTTENTTTSEDSQEGNATTIKVNEDGSVDTLDGDKSLDVQTTDDQNSETETSEGSGE